MTSQHLGRRHTCQLRRLSRGVAAILTVVLVGLGMVALSMGAAHHVRGAQDQAMTLQAQTQAQMKAWSGTELVRQFLQGLDTTKRQTLLNSAQAAGPGGSLLNFSGVAGLQAAVLPASTASEFVVSVTGRSAIGSRAETSSTVLATIGVTAGGAGSSGTPPVGGSPVLTFNRNLKLEGSITILKDAGSTALSAIHVLGDVATGGNAITGVDVIRSTGSIQIDSGSVYGELHADCDVSISGAVQVGTTKARRHVCAVGGARFTGTAAANGQLSAQGANNGTLQARSSPTNPASCKATAYVPAWNETAAATCSAPVAGMGVDLSAGGAGASTVLALGDVSLNSGQIGALGASGSLTVNWGAQVTGGTVGGTVTMPAWFPAGTVNVNTVAGYAPSITPVAAVSLASGSFDARQFESRANLAFKRDASGFIKVTVKSINGVTDGTYYVGRFGGPNYDYLCTAVTGPASDPQCSAPSNAGQSTRICRGYSDSNTCFAYDSVSQTWSVNGLQMLPGIAWFEGHLNAGNGVFLNTFIATGNITTSGSHVNYAPNFVAATGAGITLPGVGALGRGACANDRFPNTYPSQLCPTATTYTPTGLANYAYLAGSVDPLNSSNYVGGNISLGASTQAFGSVLAGNELRSGGSTTVAGYITAYGRGATTANGMGGSTTIDLRNLPATFAPAADPASTCPCAGAATAALQWARYR